MIGCISQRNIFAMSQALRFSNTIHDWLGPNMHFHTRIIKLITEEGESAFISVAFVHQGGKDQSYVC